MQHTFGFQWKKKKAKVVVIDNIDNYREAIKAYAKLKPHSDFDYEKYGGQLKLRTLIGKKKS